MNPRHCSVLVLGGSQDEISLLSEAYGDVVSASSSSDALLHLENTRTCAWKLFLIDVENMDRNINQESRLKECLKLLQKVREKIEDQTILSTVPIVCSTYDRPDFMLDCLLHGAADYILKPLRVQCIKTLFLNVYRYRHQNFKAMKRVQIRSYTDPGQRTSLPEGHVWQDFRDKLKGVFLTETWLQDTVFNYLAPKPSVEPSILQELTSDRIKYLKSRLCSWDFVPMEMDETELVECVCMIFEQILSHPDLETFRVPKDDLHQFVLDIFNSYHNTNPYHNFRHAVDVLQSTYYFLCKMGIVTPMDPGIHAAVSSTRGGICNGRRPSSSRDDVVESRMKDLLRPIHILALMMACVGHDIGHPGVTNVFMINSGTPLAVLYNDRSVLESYHSMAFFHLLSKSCFKQLTDVKHASFRKLIINSILATDMGMHDEYVQQVIDQSNRLHRHDIDFGDEITRNHERFLLCGAIIKCADISNCARPFPVAKKWAEILAEEFARQGDLERELELDVLPINQRGKVCLDEFQLTFKRKVAVKLFVAIGKVLPEMQFCLDFIRENIKQWEEEKARRETSAATSVVKGQSCTSVTTKQAIQPVNCQQSYIDDEDENNNDSGNNDHEDGLTSCPFALSPNAVEPLHSNPKSIHESSRNNRSAGCQCCIQ